MKIHSLELLPASLELVLILNIKAIFVLIVNINGVRYKMSICFQCGVEIPPGPEGKEYKWCSMECKQIFHKENFGDHFLTKEQIEKVEKEMERDGFKDLIDDVNEGKDIKMLNNDKNITMFDVIEKNAKHDEEKKKRNGFFEKKDEKQNLNIEDKKSNFFSRIWEKTVFPDKIRAKKEEKALRSTLEREARIEALKELGPALKTAYKKKELDKLMGKKEGSTWLKKLGDELAATGKNVNAGKFGMGGGMSLGGGSTAGPSTDKIMNALGKAPNVNPTAGLNKGVKKDRINQILRSRKQR